MFRRIIIVSSLIIGLAATVAMAQGARQKAGGRQGRGNQVDRRLQKLEQNLGLNPSQVNGIHALEENRRKETESLQQEIQQKRKALNQILRQPNPNPNDVGNATLALKEIRERQRGINQRFESGLKGLLTPDQLQRLPKKLQR